MTKIVILGAGNVATHLFKAFFHVKNIIVVQVYNRSQKALKTFAQKTSTTTSLQELKEADIYLLCVKDDAIKELASKIPYKNKIIAHTSGSVPLLKTSEKNGVFYPLQTFSKEVEVDFSEIPLCLEASDETTFKILKNVADAISERSYAISTKQRKSLHLAAVFVCNFPNFLYGIGENICNENQIPFDILHSLMKETTRKATLNSPSKIQTGPAKRKDLATMESHEAQLKNPDFREIYTLLSQCIMKNNPTTMETNYEAAFNRTFEEIIGIEGGYVNDPKDRGGETKFGISKRAYPHLDIKNLSLSEAKEIYYRDYWSVSTLNIQNIENHKIQLEIFDTAVNMGVGTAGRIFQKSLNILNRNERNFDDLKIDGWIGNKTLDAYDKVNKNIFLKVLNGYQFMRYENIAQKSPSQERFFNGWMKRV